MRTENILKDNETEEAIEIKELRRLLRENDIDRVKLRDAVARWESRCDALIDAIRAFGNTE